MPSTTTARLRTLLILGLAATAAALVALPTAMVQPWRWVSPMWMYHATIALANAAAWAACGLATVIALKRANDNAAFSLALFLTLSSIAYGGFTAQTAPALQTYSLIPALHAVTLIAWMFSSVALLRFASMFPQKLDPYALRDRFAPGGDIRGFEGFADTLGTMTHRMGEAVAPRLAAATSSGFLKRMRDRYVSWRDSQAAQASKTVDRMVKVHAWLMAPRNAWTAAAVIAIPVGICAMAGWVIPGAMISLYVAMPMWVAAIAYMRIGYLIGDSVDRRRSLWVVEGFMLALAPAIVCEILLFVVVLLMPQLFIATYLTGAFALSITAGAFGLVTCLGIATFHSGSFDAALVVRRTTLYSALLVVFTCIFAVVENFVTNAIAAHVALPANSSAIIAAVGVALVFGPLRDRIKALVDRRMPAAELIEERRPDRLLTPISLLFIHIDV